MTPLVFARNGWPQTSQHGNEKSIAKMKWSEFIQDNINKCTGKGLGFALHAMQDSFAPGHKEFPLWPGGIPNFSHIVGDTWPPADAWAGAVLASEGIINRFILRCGHLCSCK